VPRQPVEAELQHHLRRALRPIPLALDIGQALEKAADIDQKSGELRPHSVERLANALARGDDAVRGVYRGGIAAAVGDRGVPVRGNTRHQTGACELAAQPLAGQELHRLYQETAIAALATGQPGQRAFRLVNGHIDDACGAANPPAAEREVARALGIDASFRGGCTRGFFDRRPGQFSGGHGRTDSGGQRRKLLQTHSSEQTMASTTGSRSRPKPRPTAVMLSPQQTWARYMAHWRVKAT
jgi:hypothetical protein